MTQREEESKYPTHYDDEDYQYQEWLDKHINIDIRVAMRVPKVEVQYISKKFVKDRIRKELFSNFRKELTKQLQQIDKIEKLKIYNENY